MSRVRVEKVAIALGWAWLCLLLCLWPAGLIYHVITEDFTQTEILAICATSAAVGLVALFCTWRRWRRQPRFEPEFPTGSGSRTFRIDPDMLILGAFPVAGALFLPAVAFIAIRGLTRSELTVAEMAELLGAILAGFAVIGAFVGAAWFVLWRGPKLARGKLARIRETRERRFLAAPYCRRCKYPIHPPADGNDYACICPECGGSVHPEISQWARELSQRRGEDQAR